MRRRFLDFVELAPRSHKPRSRGLTTVVEEFFPIVWVRGMLDTYAEYVDGVKFALSCLNIPWDIIEEKIKLYRDYKLDVALDDPTFAIAYYQGKAEQLLRAARDVGFTHVQIETRHIELGEKANPEKAAEDELRYMAMARELGLKLEGEVGQKWEEGDRTRGKGGLLNVEHIISETKRLLAAGCEHVYLESHVLRAAIGDYGENERGSEQVRKVVESVGRDKMFIEITSQLPLETQMCHVFWAVRNFGPDVNLGNPSIEHMRYIEAIRRGFLFVKGPSKSTPRLWVKSLARNGGKAAEEWWREEYPIDPSLVQQR